MRKKFLKVSEEELKLIKKALVRDRDSYDELYERYKDSIKGYIISHLINRNYAEDIMQETWQKVWEKISTYNPERGSFYSFVRFWAEIMVKRANAKSFLNANVIDNKIVNKDVTFQDTPFKEPLEKYEIFLKIVFREGGTPHQLIAFGFNKLLTGWGPNKIVKDLSFQHLEKLTERLIMDYKEESQLPSYVVNSAFNPLKEKMTKKVEDILEKKDSKSKYKKLMKMEVGKTMLNDYYGRDPEHNISDWCEKVKKRVLREIRKIGLTHEKGK